MNKNPVTLFSLGLEELAMALGLINRPDMGRELIASIYEDLSEDQIENRLSSGSHSLLARGLVAISDKGTPILESTFEQALFPLARFDYTLQLSRVRKSRLVSASVHVQKGRTFTSHSVQVGIVHVLEHGAYKDLPGFLRKTFNLAGGQNAKSVEFEWMVSPGMLGETIRGANQMEIMEIIGNAGVPTNDAKDLAADLAQQTERGTILRVQVDSETDAKAVLTTDKQMLMLLCGKKRDWLFKFGSTTDNAPGKAFIVNSNTFQKHLELFAL